jgi:glycosyltransferase involved in cell wall biosynthesis
VPAYVGALARALGGRGWSVAVACDPRSPLAAELRDSGIEVVNFRADRAPSVRDLRAAIALVGAVRTQRPGVIHAHSSKAGALVGLLSAALRVPHVYTPHGWAFEMDIHPMERDAYVAVERVLTRTVRDMVVNVGVEERRQGLTRGVLVPTRDAVVRTGWTRQGGRPRDAARVILGLPPDGAVAGWIGRAGPQKRSGDLPNLARELAARGITLVCLGAGLELSAEGREVRDRGGIVVPDSSDPLDVLASSDVIVSTSAWEGLPLALIEALELGLPIVAYGVGGVTEQVRPGVNGYLVGVGDTARLAVLVASCLARPSTAKAFGAESRRLWLSRFEPVRMVDRMEIIYRDLLDAYASRHRPATWRHVQRASTSSRAANDASRQQASSSR